MKATVIVVVVVALLGGFGTGYMLGVNVEDEKPTSTEHQHATSTSHGHNELFEVEQSKAPTVEIAVNEDAKSGWNIELSTTNFAFTPFKVNGDNFVGEGHAHLYVDDVKVARLYGPNYHYDENFDGTREFRVTLNANDHSAYAVDGERIEATLTVTHESHN